MLGIDIIDLNRLKDNDNLDKLCNKLFTKEELMYIKSKNDQESCNGISSRIQTIGGMFSAKESVLKAVGVGMTNGFGFKDVVIGHNMLGKPVVSVSKKLETYIKKLGLDADKIHVSISHDGGLAITNCIIEK